MSYTTTRVQNEIVRHVNKAFFAGNPMGPTLTALATSVGAETKVHDATMEQYITPTLHPGKAPDRWQANILLTINKGFAGNLTAAQMASILTTLSAGPFPLSQIIFN